MIKDNIYFFNLICIKFYLQNEQFQYIINRLKLFNFLEYWSYYDTFRIKGKI